MQATLLVCVSGLYHISESTLSIYERKCGFPSSGGLQHTFRMSCQGICVINLVLWLNCKHRRIYNCKLTSQYVCVYTYAHVCVLCLCKHFYRRWGFWHRQYTHLVTSVGQRWLNVFNVSRQTTNRWRRQGQRGTTDGLASPLLATVLTTTYNRHGKENIQTRTVGVSM